MLYKLRLFISGIAFALYAARINGNEQKSMIAITEIS
jgi:hypothetical protein